MHFVVLVETDAQNALCTGREITCKGVGLVEEGIAGLHTNSQLVLARSNLHSLRFQVMIAAKNPHFLFWRALDLPLEDCLIVYPNRYIRLRKLFLHLNVDCRKTSW